MSRSRKGPGIIAYSLFQVVVGICGLYGLFYGIAFLFSTASVIGFYLGLVNEHTPIWFIFASLALTGLYLASGKKLLEGAQIGGTFGLIANSISFLMPFSRLAAERKPRPTFNYSKRQACDLAKLTSFNGDTLTLKEEQLESHLRRTVDPEY